MGTVRDTIARSTLDELFKRKKAAGQISWSAAVKPVRAKDRAMIAQAYDSAVVREKMSTEDPDRALIAEAYLYLKESGQLPPPAEDVIMCVHSSDPLTDFFETHGLSKCKEQICAFAGIETAADLAMLTEQDVTGPRFREWATYNLSIVQHRKVLLAFAGIAN
jgi:hypothetical protein